jgi:hypothetical protein
MSEPAIAADFEEWKKLLAQEEDEITASRSGIVFSTRGCATAEEADAALEAFLMRAFGVSDEHP